MVIDDTQALGIMGRSPGLWTPYGSGGGGSLAAAGVRDPRVVVVGSLAKAFGAPVAMVAGSAARISDFEQRSLTRVHCSPPSAAAIAAAAAALEINRRVGDRLRARLADRVVRFRCGVVRLAASAGLFPVQHLRLPSRADARRLYEQLLDRGIQTVLTRGDHESGARIGFVLTARNTSREIDHALACLAELLGRPATPRGGIRNGKPTDEPRATAHTIAPS
jgi:8-amino-7-oxononanoate synthase